LNYVLDLVALPTSCLAFYVIIRAKKTYFMDSGFFIGLASVGFICYLVEASYADITASPVSPIIDNTLIGIMGSSIGVASYLLKGSYQKTLSGMSEIKRFIAKPPLPFLLFLAAVWSWTIASLVLQPWMLNHATNGGIFFYYTYPEWFVAAGALLLASFIGLPVTSFYRQSRIIGEKTASFSMKIIAICWTMFGVSLFAQIAASALMVPGMQDIGFVADGFLFVLIAFALREPTVMARIVTASEAVSQVVSSRSDLDTIVLYNAESDRRKLVETVVRDGLSKGLKMVCRVTKSEVPFYRAVLKGSGVLSTDAGKDKVLIEPIETGSSVSKEVDQHSEQAMDMAELVDLDELDLELAKEVIEGITSLDGRIKGDRTGRIWALNVDGSQTGILEILTTKSPRSRLIDLAHQQDVFSSLLQLKHQDILGSRMLLEYEPTSNYESIVREFVREFQTNVESIAIFANAGSPVCREFSEQRNVKLFTSSTKTSTPSRISNEQILLPERDTSLLLDAVDKLLEAHSERRIGIVFEVFTYLILSLGFEKAYGVISTVVEMAESQVATILVLVNSDALEPRTLSGLRGLFQTQLFFDSNGLKVVRLVGEDYGKTDDVRLFSDSIESPRRIGA
jgi:hypothetical protein